VLHPWGAAKICAQLQLDDETIAAALLHDVVEDTDVDLEDVRAEFGDEIAKLVEGVTKLTRVQFQSREQAEAENYRKLIIAMAEDVRVILIKLADRLHNLREIEYLGKQKQVQKAKETLEVYAPLAHRLGIHALKWELEDLAFETLHPRKYEEIKAMVTERRADREGHVSEAARILQLELDKVDIPAEISGRAKHFYSIYDKMAKKGREFNEIYDLTAMRVIVRALRRRGDARLLRRARPDPLALEADARPLQGLHRDAEVQPLPVTAHDRDRAGGPAARDPGCAHARCTRKRSTAIAAHWRYKGKRAAGPTRPGRRGCAN
jgi:GTP pyrophosphokinase